MLKEERNILFKTIVDVGLKNLGEVHCIAGW